jgi:glycerol transport system ATP-binding protein
MAAARRRHGCVRRRRLIAELQRGYPFLALSMRAASRAPMAPRHQAARRREIAADLGQTFGATLTEREVRYLMANEWAVTAEDIVWRRSKLGLRLSADEIAALERLDQDPRRVAKSPAGSGRTLMTVTLDHVTRTVDGVAHIRDVSLTLESGTLNVLLGPTLSGKTSIMRLLAGLDKPTTGKVLVNGKDVTGVDVRQRSVAMVYQQFINYPSFTVYENIASPLRVQGKPREEIEARVTEAARLLRLEPFLKRTPLQLSGGQQQRTAMARALVKGADLVLLDEPLANLDYKLREELRAELPRIFEASGAIFVYATTEPTEALLLGGNTVCMWEGQALQIGGTPNVYRHPQTLRVAQVFSDPPLTSSASRRRTVPCNMREASPRRRPASIPLSPTAPIASVFRAHQLALANGETDRHAFHATVTVTEITGSESFVHLTRDGLNWVAVLHGVHEFEPGQTIDAVLDPNDVFVFDAADRLVAAPGNS